MSSAGISFVEFLFEVVKKYSFCDTDHTGEPDGDDNSSIDLTSKNLPAKQEVQMGNFKSFQSYDHCDDSD